MEDERWWRNDFHLYALLRSVWKTEFLVLLPSNSQEEGKLRRRGKKKEEKKERQIGQVASPHFNWPLSPIGKSALTGASSSGIFWRRKVTTEERARVPPTPSSSSNQANK